MLNNRTNIIESINSLSSTELIELSTYIDYIKFRSNYKMKKNNYNDSFKHYADFEEEDTILAEEGMDNYLKSLSSKFISP
ncbi:MAG: hypothetical protein A2X61_03750 [Ignavibacteria bacterium GWB2_35_12]|nr:MAG: hypothetical protein A2X63_00915 [Ignavibacteria bacterium GWA2_35_8]OGU40400.1 MAG: hypothetical protein A2X61_03750 [Ignavibacteria bacterium GWB2_35_12]OGU92193.1 MAG: hypothetical protein A2220_13690 [Ignavibacteria bacterium RIFOXYA2_FULL_35_10]OGV22536.1 MAG: hypothetical protein A2475_03425 [Ignavibacteria bacterium RIFOXYC2_FULL_35_21]